MSNLSVSKVAMTQDDPRAVSHTFFDPGQSQRNVLVLIILGLAALYFPTYWVAWNSIWQTDDLGHGPVILCVTVWLFWQSKKLLTWNSPNEPNSMGGVLLILGLILLFFGRIFNISSVEFASHIPVVSGVVLLIYGKNVLRGLWFPIIYLVFLIPLPAVLVDYLTQPLKGWISFLAVNTLHLFGYPAGRSGVIINIGQYQLLVADACAGMHSMFSLAALGALYLHIMKRPSLVQNLLMILAVLPIAFTANFLRVMLLILITFHLGDEAGQGFLHGAAGMILWLLALIGFFLSDWLLSLIFSKQ